MECNDVKKQEKKELLIKEGRKEKNNFKLLDSVIFYTVLPMNLSWQMCYSISVLLMVIKHAKWNIFKFVGYRRQRFRADKLLMRLTTGLIPNNVVS